MTEFGDAFVMTEPVQDFCQHVLRFARNDRIWNRCAMTEPVQDFRQHALGKYQARPLDRVHGDAVDPHLPVQVWPSR